MLLQACASERFEFFNRIGQKRTNVSSKRTVALIAGRQLYGDGSHEHVGERASIV